MRPIVLLSATLLMLLLNSACSSQETSQKTINNAMSSFPEFDLQGHRGARGLLPENTIPSLLKALEFEIKTLEFDVVVSADSKIVLSHEPWFHHHISTKPNGEPVTPDVALQHNMFNMTYAEIAEYDVGKRGHILFPEQVPMPAVKPLMKDAIKAVEEHITETEREPVFYNIETKSQEEWYDVFVPQPEVFARLLYNELKELDVLHKVFIQSFDVRTLQEMRAIDPNVPLVLLVQNLYGLEENLRLLGFTPDVYSPNYRLVDEELVKEVHAKGMKIVPWTINDTKTMKTITNMGVDGLITDYPNHAVTVKPIKQRLGLK